MNKRKEEVKNFWIHYFAAFLNLKQDVLEKIEEVKIINQIKPTLLLLRKIEQVYMESIILDMAKIIGVSNCDQTGIKEIKKYLDDDDFKNKLDQIEEKYKTTIIKIRENRNRIISHLDFYKNPYYNLKFSRDHLEKMIGPSSPEAHALYGGKKNFEKVKERIMKKCSSSKEEERYCPIDLNKDVELFLSIIEELDEIFGKINLTLLR